MSNVTGNRNRAMTMMSTQKLTFQPKKAFKKSWMFFDESSRNTVDAPNCVMFTQIDTIDLQNRRQLFTRKTNL